VLVITQIFMASNVDGGEQAHEERRRAYFWGGRRGIGLFLSRVLRGDVFWVVSSVECKVVFLGWIRETFSLISVICEWTACRDCLSLRAISDGRSLFTIY